MGKIRGSFEISAEADQEAIKKEALAQENVQKHLEGKDIKKIIVVPQKLVSIVAK
jgi:leucyl-tRNA synthetase